MSAVYDVEVELASARPPTPSNTRTHHVRIVMPTGLTFTEDTEARCLAALMVWPLGAMVTAARIVGLEL